MNPLAIFEIGAKLIDSLYTSDEEKAVATQKLHKLAQDGELKELAIAASVITAETNSESWITRNWRPITMLTFVGLIAAHWMGFTAPNLAQSEITGLLELVKIGLGGYVISRGAEKAIKEYKK